MLFSFYKKNFKFNRVFFIDGKKNIIRGNHAHIKTRQIIININAKASIEITNKKTKKINFYKSGDYVEVPKMNWVKIYFKNDGFIAVICDKKYLKNDYINDFNKFKKKIKKFRN